MNRRKFLKYTGAGVVSAVTMGTGCGSTSPASDPAPPPPVNTRKNLLFILCDDLNDQINGLGGHPQAWTPNIDRLRSLGVTFSNAHANAPLCAPSRASMLSGLLPSTTGHYHDEPEGFRDRSRLRNTKVITEHLKDNGYQVYFTGKVFHSNHTSAFGVDAVWDQDAYLGHLSSYGPYPWDGNPSFIIANTTNPDFPNAIRDLDFSFGRLSKPPLFPNGVAKWTYGDPSYVGVDGRNRGEFRYISPTDRSLTPDELSARWSANLIQGKPARSYARYGQPKTARPISGSAPFAIFCGLTATHTPLFLPDDLFDEVLAVNNITSVDDILLPELLPGDLALLMGDTAGSTTLERDISDIPKRLYPINKIGSLKFNAMIEAGKEWPGGAVRLFKETIHAYLAAVLHLDKQVGVMLDALESSGLINNTMIVLTSDNGYSRAEKNWDFKYNLWGESTRVPLIIHDPAIPALKGTNSDFPCSLVDIYPTINASLGLAAPEIRPGQLPLDGQSLTGLLHGENTGLKPVALSAVKTWRMKASDDTINPDNAAASAVSSYWRYTQSFVLDGVEEELYNRKEDPNEWHNLAKDPRYLEVKKYFDYWISHMMACGDFRRTQIYGPYEPGAFNPDSLA